MDLGDCDICNAVVLLVILVLSGLFIMWNQSQKTAAVSEKQPNNDPTSAAEPKKAGKSKSKTKSKDKKEKTGKTATKETAPKDKAEKAPTKAVPAQVPLSENESEGEMIEVEAPKKKSKKNKKNKKAATGGKNEEEDTNRTGAVANGQKTESDGKAASAAEKKNSKKGKEGKPKVAKLAAAKQEQDSWIDVESSSTPNHNEPQPTSKQPAPTQKAAPKKQQPKPTKSADDYLKDLPEEIRERIKQQNSKESQLAKTAKNAGNRDSFSNDDWILTKDENVNSGHGGNGSAIDSSAGNGAGAEKAKFAKAQETNTDIDSVTMKVAEVKKIYCKANIWNKTHESKVEEKKVLSKVQLAGNILDYTW